MYCQYGQTFFNDLAYLHKSGWHMRWQEVASNSQTVLVAILSFHSGNILVISTPFYGCNPPTQHLIMTMDCLFLLLGNIE